MDKEDRQISDHTKIWYGILKQGIQDMFDAGKISQAQYNETIDMLNALLAEEDRQIYEQMIKRVMGDFRSRQYAESVVTDCLYYQGKEPPDKSPFPEISPGTWHDNARADDDTNYIYDGRGNVVCKVMTGEFFEADKALILAAPDLREQVYEDRKLIVRLSKTTHYSNLTRPIDESTEKSLEVLKAAGVNMEGL